MERTLAHFGQWQQESTGGYVQEEEEGDDNLVDEQEKGDQRGNR